MKASVHAVSHISLHSPHALFSPPTPMPSCGVVLAPLCNASFRKIQNQLIHNGKLRPVPTWAPDENRELRFLILVIPSESNTPLPSSLQVLPYCFQLSISEHSLRCNLYQVRPTSVDEEKYI
jgi:hypothetical protein